MHAWVGIDFETRSEREISAGTAEYAAGRWTEGLCLAWQWPGADVAVDGIAANRPSRAHRELMAHVEAGGAVVAHNADFELDIWALHHAREPSHWPRLRPEQVYCTMAAARAVALPGALASLAPAMGLPIRKDEEGAKLMKRMSKPAGWKGGAPLWLDTPELRARLMEYCKVDVEVQTLAWLALPKLSETERALWLLDRRINARGFGVDRATARAAIGVLAKEADALNEEVRRLTDGAVSSGGAAVALRKWLASQGVHLDNLQKTTVTNTLAGVSGAARRALEIRQIVSKSSTAKLEPMLDRSRTCGRVRGTLAMYGANTGRWAGAGPQPQNLTRPAKGWKVAIGEQAAVAMRRAAAGDTALLREMSAKWGSAHAVAANMMRNLIQAASGHRLTAADYSNIEGRGLSWLANEAWKLGAFRKFDTLTLDGSGRPIKDAKGEWLREGPDNYKLAYSRSFGVPIEDVTDDERQIGKVQELALGYAGSIGAFLSMAANYNVDLAALAAIAQRAIDPDDWQEACSAYDRVQFDPEAAEEVEAEDANPDYAFLEPFKGDPRRGLPREQWAAIRCIVRSWRAAHPATVAWWKALDRAALAALDAWGTVHHAGPVAYSANRSALRCRLPSGRYLTYPYARVIRGESKRTGKPQTVMLYNASKGGAKTWRPTRIYGGLLAENVTQAVARDLLANALLKLETSGYATVLHVHDEIVCEMPNGVGTAAEFRRICETRPDWALDFPLVTGEPWEGERYRK